MLKFGKLTESSQLRQIIPIVLSTKAHNSNAVIKSIKWALAGFA